MADNIFLFIVFYLEVFLFYYLPVFNGKGTLFGLIIDDEKENNFSFQILKSYRKYLIVISILFLLGMILTVNYSVKSLPFLYIGFTLSVCIVLYLFLQKAWRLRKPNVISKTAVSLKPRKLSNFTHYWLEIGVVLLSILPIAVLYYFYPQLPEKIPVHWGINGQPDRWEAKSLISVFSPLIIGLFIQIPLFLIKTEIIKARMRVPAEFAEQILPLKEMSLSANCNLLDWSRLMISVIFTNIGFFILSTLGNESIATFLNIWMWVGVMMLLIGIGYFCFQLIKINQEIKNLTGQITFQTATEESGWNNDLIYFNKNDSAFMVEKISGGGYTFNFANKKSWLYLALFIIPEFIVLILFAVNSK